MVRTAQDVFQQFVDTFGSRRECAIALGCSYVLVCSILNGARAVSKEIAERANELRPQFAREALVFGDMESKDANAMTDEQKKAA